jgi:hypothetical protein
MTESTLSTPLPPKPPVIRAFDEAMKTRRARGDREPLYEADLAEFDALKEAAKQRYKGFETKPDGSFVLNSCNGPTVIRLKKDAASA